MLHYVKKIVHKKTSNIKKNISDKPVVLDISVLDIGFVDDFMKLLNTEIQGKKSILIDASKVERITTPCIQLLLACAQSIKKKRGVFAVKPSQPIRDTFGLMGLGKTIEEWSKRYE